MCTCQLLHILRQGILGHCQLVKHVKDLVSRDYIWGPLCLLLLPLLLILPPMAPLCLLLPTPDRTVVCIMHILSCSSVSSVLSLYLLLRTRVGVELQPG
jgi:hypothetical protein